MNKGIETFNKDEKQFFHDFRGKEDLMNKGIETGKAPDRVIGRAYKFLLWERRPDE